MNWKKEVQRIELDFSNVTFNHFSANYYIGEIEFFVEIEYDKTVFDHEDGKWAIDIEIKEGKWSKIGEDEYYPMEFEPSYKDWMLSMVEHCMDEHEFLSEFTWGDGDFFDFDEWSLYGI
jgi:hypothetical protein